MTTQEKVAAMTDKQCRTRLVEIAALTAKGDYSWSFDEYTLITNRLPEEIAKNKQAAKRQVARAKRRAYR